MKPAERVIAAALVYDHRPTIGARRVLEALRAEGYEVVRVGPILPPQGVAAVTPLAGEVISK